MESHIEKVDKNAAVKHQSTLSKFFLEALEFRTSCSSKVSRAQIQTIEKTTCSALVRLALKLPEASLRPLIFKIFTWASLEGSPKTRLFSLYSLYTSLAEALKSMFPLFTGNLSRHLIELIPKINNDKNPTFEDADDQREILTGILDVIKSILIYDHGEFLDEQASNELIPILVNLIEMTHLSQYEEFTDNFLVWILILVQHKLNYFISDPDYCSSRSIDK